MLEDNVLGVTSPKDEPWYGESLLVMADGITVPDSDYYPATTDEWHQVTVPIKAYVSTLSLMFWDMTDSGYLFVDDIRITYDEEPAVVAGGRHSLALKYDGSLLSWGDNLAGQLGIGNDPDTQCTPAAVSGGHHWAKMAAGPTHTLAIREDGTLWSWGGNNSGQLGLGYSGDSPVYVESLPNQVGTDSNWACVAAGGDFSLAVKQDGSLWAWGENGDYQLGQTVTTPDNMDRDHPCQVVEPAGYSNDWASVAGGANFALALKKDGTLWGWGSNGIGQLGQGTATPGDHLYNPTQIGSDTWKSIATGSYHSLGVKRNSTLWAWGSNLYGQLGLGTGATASVPTQVGTGTGWSFADSFHQSSFALTDSGKLYAWGQNVSGQLGLGDQDTRYTPVQVAPGTTFAAVSTGSAHTLAMTGGGEMRVFGSHLYCQLGLGEDAPTSQTSPGNLTTSTKGSWIDVAAGAYHTLAIRDEGNLKGGSLWAWGRNNSGQLGLGDTRDRSRPVRVGTGTDWVMVAGGGWHSLGICSDGSLWAWGYNNDGQLGLDDPEERHIPVQVGDSTDWVMVAGGMYHSLGIRSDGSLWAWGSNYYGQLGLGDIEDPHIPVHVGDNTDWVIVAGDYYHSLGIRSDGSLWAWGYNFYGQLGLGVIEEQNLPVKVGDSTDWVTVAGGFSHSLGIRTDRSFWAWGGNIHGQLGLGDTEEQNLPVKVGTGTDWVMVAGGLYYSLGIRSDGSLWAWGGNAAGQLGLGDTEEQHIPVKVGDSTDWVMVDGNYFHSLGIRSDGSLWAWGSNFYGQLGLGDKDNRDIPVEVVTKPICLPFIPLLLLD